MKTIKLISVLALTSALTSTATKADTYSTTVNIDNVATSLTWAETAPMQFATVIIDGATTAGMKCVTHRDDANQNALCPGDRTNVTDAMFTLTGSPNGGITATIDGTVQTKEGISFQPFISTFSTFLDASGNGTARIQGHLTMVDKTLNTSPSITFDYDLEFASQ